LSSVVASTRVMALTQKFEIGRILHLKSEIRDQCCPVEHFEQPNKFNSINA
jgi:hypothetical protein